MKTKLLYWWALVTLVFLCLPVTALAVDGQVGVSYRGHIQDLGDYPADGSWVNSPEIIGTTGQSKRIEGFEIKLTGTIPAGMELRYNVHVQNKGWLYNENDSADWLKDGDYAGTRGDSLRIEAVKIVLTDSDGKPFSGYRVEYRGHVQNVGDLPADDSQWLADGDQLGTVGSSQRLEALLVQVIKTAVEPAEPVVYDAAGTYGPATGTEKVAGDVIIKADGVNLQNLEIQGNLTIAEEVGSGTVTLNNVTVTGDTFVRGGGVNSIHINGGQYARIIMEKTASGAVRIVATGVDGLDVVIAEDATGEAIILEGAFDSVVVNAPNMTVTTQGNATTIGTMTVGADAGGTTLNLAAGTTVTDLVLDGTAAVKGQGTVTKAEVNADSVVFEKAPGSYAVESDVVIPPVFPAPGGGGGTPSKPTLTITNPTITDSKFYDGNTSAVVTAGDLIGVAAGDAGNVSVSATASYDNKNVGNGNKSIRVVYTLGGTAAANYNKPADYLLTTGTITAKALTIADPALTTVKQYDGNTSAAVTAGALSGKETWDTVTVTPVASYNDATRAGGKTITVVYTLGGGDAGNYSAPANYEVTNGEITKKQLTINLTSLTAQKVYDGDATADAAGTLLGVVNNENVGLNINATYDSKDVGDPKTITLTYTINGTNQADYLAPATETRPGKITAKPLEATAVTVTSAKEYDSFTTAAITGGGTVSGAVFGESVDAAAVANYNDNKAGEGKTITVSYNVTGAADVIKNYSAPASYTYTTSGKITARPLNITTPPTVTLSKIYDGNATAAVSAGTVAGVLGTDAVSASATASYADATVNTNKPITIVYSLSGNDAGNYSKPTNGEVTGSITPKILSYILSTNAPSRVYDQTTAAPVTASNLSGIVGTEQVSIAATTANYNSKDVGSGKTVTVSVTLTGTNSGNYQVVVPQLTGEITAKPLTATPVTVTTEKVYDSLTTAAITSGGTVSGALNGETVGATVAANYNDKKAGENKPITVSFSLTGNADVTKNYSVPASYEYTNSGKITAKPLTIQAPNLTTTKPYDGNTSAAVTAGSLNGKEIGDSLTASATASYDTATNGTGKTITVVYTLDGDDKLNYTALDNYEVTNGVISSKQLTISGQNLTTTKVYDGVIPATAAVTPGTLVGVVANENVTVTTTATYNNGDLGFNKPITVSYQISGTTGNYLPPVGYTINTGIIKKDILVYSYNSTNSSWMDTTASLAPTITSLPLGHTIFDLDNAGNVYAWASDRTIKKYIGNSWIDAFGNDGIPGNFKFAGIDIYLGVTNAVGVDLNNGNFFQHGLDPSSIWEAYGTTISKPDNNYQLVGGYNLADNFYLVYKNGTSLYQYDPYAGSPTMLSLASLSPDINTAIIPAGYTICGFNYTSQLNMYLTK